MGAPQRYDHTMGAKVAAVAELHAEEAAALRDAAGLSAAGAAGRSASVVGGGKLRLQLRHPTSEGDGSGLSAVRVPPPRQ